MPHCAPKSSTTLHYVRVTYVAGNRVEYVGRPVFDLIIRTGDVGTVTRVQDGWVHALWPRSGEHSVPVEKVRPVQPFPSPWWRPEPNTLEALRVELEAEIAPGHVLDRLPVDIRGRCAACDEVLVSVVDGSFALVHLTWSGHREGPPSPRVTARGQFAGYDEALRTHAAEHG